MATRRKARNVLTGRNASVSFNRNGLHIEIADVPAVEAAAVASILLKMTRELIKAGYDELVLDGGTVPGGGVEMPEEDGVDSWVEPPTAHRPRPIGFGR